jgi:hypothetical protein
VQMPVGQLLHGVDKFVIAEQVHAAESYCAFARQSCLIVKMVGRTNT